MFLSSSSIQIMVPDLRQTIIRTNDDLLLSKSIGTNFSDIWIKIPQFSFKKLNIKMSVQFQPFCLGINMLTLACYIVVHGLTRSSLIHGDYHLLRTKPLPAATMTHHQVDPWKQISVKFESRFNNAFKKMNLNISSAKCRKFCLASMGIKFFSPRGINKDL